MPYIEDRLVHDADAHIMETPNWLRDYADPEIRAGIVDPGYVNELRQTGDNEKQLADLANAFSKIAKKHASAEYRENESEEIMNRKNFAATGAFVKEDRPRCLDMIGVASQLLFNTFHNRKLRDWERGDDLDFAYGVARAHNRGMLDFCSVDARLLASCYVPLADFERAEAMAKEALEAGASALLIQSGCPKEIGRAHG